MNRRRVAMIAGLAVAMLAGTAAFVASAPVAQLEGATRIPRPPAISPDYSGLTIPPNIAPLNFVVKEPGTAFRVSIRADKDASIELATRSPAVSIPVEGWRALLEANPSGEVRFEVTVRGADGRWSQFEPIRNRIAAEPIDGYLIYRYMDPVFRCWGDISIRQRGLAGFDETVITSNRSFSYDCVNCHSVNRARPDMFALQLRSESLGAKMLLARDGQVTKVSTSTPFSTSPASYLSLHPNGRIVAFASIKVTQFFHAVGETRDVFDEASDLGLYLIDSNTVTTTPAIARPDRLETYPQWSPDGKYLYFCSAPQLPVAQYKEVLYDLVRIPYDPDTGAWGEPETLIAAQDIKGSMTHPRVSPDGRFLMFCLCSYGNFSIYHPESDLYLLDLTTRKHWKMELNSDLADSYHSWSGSSRWVVFSSKRRDGLLTHPYIAHIDEQGHASKPFILPQKDPAFYESSLKVFNVPELASTPIAIASRTLSTALRTPTDSVSATLDPKVTIRNTTTAPEAPWKPAR